jgi:hypothetical protein
LAAPPACGNPSDACMASCCMNTCPVRS